MTTEKIKKTQYIVPKFEVKDLKDEYKVSIYTPGVKKEDVKISLKDDIVTVIAEKNTPNENEKWQSHYKEINNKSFKLKLKINFNLDENKINAKVENGVVDLTLHTAEESKEKEISIK